jgi:hypothetical protein
MNLPGIEGLRLGDGKIAHGGERSDFFLLIQGFPIGVAK